MKTYEEALKVAWIPLNKPETEQLAAASRDHAERGLPIAEEAIQNPMTYNLIQTLMVAVNLDPTCDCERCRKEFTLAMSAYLNGIRIGMEMEKQTL